MRRGGGLHSSPNVAGHSAGEGIAMSKGKAKAADGSGQQLGHLTEAIQALVEVSKAQNERLAVLEQPQEQTEQAVEPAKRGRPKGSKNRLSGSAERNAIRGEFGSGEGSKAHQAEAIDRFAEAGKPVLMEYISHGGARARMVRDGKPVKGMESKGLVQDSRRYRYAMAHMAELS